MALQVLWQVDDVDGLKWALLHANTTPNAQGLTDEGRFGGGVTSMHILPAPQGRVHGSVTPTAAQRSKLALTHAHDGTRLAALLPALLGLALQAKRAEGTVQQRIPAQRTGETACQLCKCALPLPPAPHTLSFATIAIRSFLSAAAMANFSGFQ